MAQVEQRGPAVIASRLRSNDPAYVPAPIGSYAAAARRQSGVPGTPGIPTPGSAGPRLSVAADSFAPGGSGARSIAPAAGITCASAAAANSSTQGGDKSPKRRPSGEPEKFTQILKDSFASFADALKPIQAQLAEHGRLLGARSLSDGDAGDNGVTAPASDAEHESGHGEQESSKYDSQRRRGRSEPPARGRQSRYDDIESQDGYSSDEEEDDSYVDYLPFSRTNPHIVAQTYRDDGNRQPRVRSLYGYRESDILNKGRSARNPSVLSQTLGYTEAIVASLWEADRALSAVTDDLAAMHSEESRAHVPVADLLEFFAPIGATLEAVLDLVVEQKGLIVTKALSMENNDPYARDQLAYVEEFFRNKHNAREDLSPELQKLQRNFAHLTQGAFARRLAQRAAKTSTGGGGGAGSHRAAASDSGDSQEASWAKSRGRRGGKKHKPKKSSGGANSTRSRARSKTRERSKSPRRETRGRSSSPGGQRSNKPGKSGAKTKPQGGRGGKSGGRGGRGGGGAPQSRARSRSASAASSHDEE